MIHWLWLIPCFFLGAVIGMFSLALLQGGGHK